MAGDRRTYGARLPQLRVSARYRTAEVRERPVRPEVRERIAALERLGVHAVITNRPELFYPTISQVAAE